MNIQTPTIYVLPEPYQGFIRLDSIYSAFSAEADQQHDIKDRVIIRYGIETGHQSDMVIDCPDFETASKRANEIRRMVENLDESRNK